MRTDSTRKKRGLTDRFIAKQQEKATQPAIGLEAEFTLLVDGQPAKPEDVFGSPTAFVRQKMMHRTGRSYHLPTGCAVYFDTGVIEVATPMIELEPGCAARAGRSLWESIHFLRQELDAWEERKQHEVHLAGFSAHYNVSFELPQKLRGKHRTVHKLAILLTYILPVPVMLLAANRESTGIGVRPRQNRIEITADFTPDAPLSIATATLIVAVVREVMSWPSYELDQLDRINYAVLRKFAPIPHSSRKGWVAKFSCFAQNPFQCDIDAPIWDTRDGSRRSLRDIAALTTRVFSRSIRHYADPLSRTLISAVMHGSAPSLLELPERPDCYHDVGRACSWDNLYTERTLARSRYERVLMRAIARQPVVIEGEQYTPTGMHGWSHVVFRRQRDGQRQELSLDELVEHLVR
ncbi:MAG: hypothetical protein ACR2IE_07640 [Candidatus Sumerlaeaceae bacterium]